MNAYHWNDTVLARVDDEAAQPEIESMAEDIAAQLEDRLTPDERVLKGPYNDYLVQVSVTLVPLGADGKIVCLPCNGTGRTMFIEYAGGPPNGLCGTCGGEGRRRPRGLD